MDNPRTRFCITMESASAQSGGESSRCDAMSVREAALISAIRSRLANDKRVGDLPVAPYIVGNDVYLVGRVETLEQRDIVEFIVRGTPGISRVNSDELEVAELSRGRQAAT